MCRYRAALAAIFKKMESNDFPWVWPTTPIYVTQRIQGLKSISTLSWHFQSILSNFVGGATRVESGCKLGDYQPLRRHLRPHKLGRAMQVSRKLKGIHPHFGPKLFFFWCVPDLHHHISPLALWGGYWWGQFYSLSRARKDNSFCY